MQTASSSSLKNYLQEGKTSLQRSNQLFISWPPLDSVGSDPPVAAIFEQIPTHGYWQGLSAQIKHTASEMENHTSGLTSVMILWTEKIVKCQGALNNAWLINAHTDPRPTCIERTPFLVIGCSVWQLHLRPRPFPGNGTILSLQRIQLQIIFQRRLCNEEKIHSRHRTNHYYRNTTCLYSTRPLTEDTVQWQPEATVQGSAN